MSVLKKSGKGVKKTAKIIVKVGKSKSAKKLGKLTLKVAELYLDNSKKS